MLQVDPPKRPEVALREARAEDLPELAGVLARAFESDPVLRFLMPDANIRMQRATRFYQLVLSQFANAGVITTDESRGAAAIWQAPNPPMPGLLTQAYLGARMISILRRRAIAGYELLEAMERVHYEAPHWYLALLGTDPEQRGRGIASALIRRVTRICDRDGLPAYLESSNETNISFYESHGFTVVQEIRISDGPTLWPMLRQPRRGAP